MGCHLQGSPAARKQQAREAARPTVGRVVAPRAQVGWVRPEREVRKRVGSAARTPEAIVTDESEQALLAAGLLLGADDPGEGIKWHRNNNGIANTPGGGRLTYGLGSGTADYVGRLCPYGLWFSLEFKAPGKQPEEHQWNHIRRVRSDGGWADYSDSAERTVRLIREALAWAKERVR